jgi:cytochrome b
MKPLATDTATAIPTERVLVWDAPTRVFHWLLVLSFAGAYVTGDADRLKALHALFGYTAGGLVAFRVLWGIIGTRHARFAGLPLAPHAVRSCVRSVLQGVPQHHAGHNPAGSWAVLLLLALVALTALTGWSTLTERGPDWLEDVHEGLANAAVTLVVIHVAGVLLGSWQHRENLVRAMVDGYKAAGAGAAAAGARWFVAVALLAGVLAFWGGWIPAPGVVRGTGMAAWPASVSGGEREATRDERRRGRRERARDDD